MSIPWEASKRFGRPSSRARVNATRSNAVEPLVWQLSQSLTAPDLSARRWASIPRTTSRRPTMSSLAADDWRSDSSRRMLDQRSRPLMPLPAGSKSARTSPPSRSPTSRSVSVRPVSRLDETQSNHPLRLRGVAGGAGDGVEVQRGVRQPGRVERRGGRVAADAGRADQFGAGAALHVVGAVAIRAERGVEVIAGRAGLAVHAPGVGRENLRVTGAARRAGERREALLRRHLVGAVAVGAPRGALGPGAQQREVDAPLGLAQLVGVAAGAGAAAAMARLPCSAGTGGVRAGREPGVAIGAGVVGVHGSPELGRVHREFHRRCRPGAGA